MRDGSDIQAAIKASLESQIARREGKIPPNKTQVGSPKKTSEHTSPGIQSLQTHYPGLRTVRGDGNCYYRSIVYGLIEQMVISPHRAKLFEQLATKIQALEGAYSGQYDAEINAMLLLLQQARDGQRWGSVKALENDMRSPNSTTDALLVRCARLFTALAAEKIDAHFREPNDIASILTMGHDASGAPLQTGALLNALGISGTIEIIDPHDVQIEGLASGGAEDPLVPSIAVHVLLKGGHYDLIYAPEQWSKIYAPKQQTVAQTMKLLEQFTQDIINKPLAKHKSKKAFISAVHLHSKEEQVKILRLSSNYLNDNIARLNASKRANPIVLEKLEQQAQVIEQTVNTLCPLEENKENSQEDHPLPPKGFVMQLIENILSLIEQLFGNLVLLFSSSPRSIAPERRSSTREKSYSNPAP